MGHTVTAVRKWMCVQLKSMADKRRVPQREDNGKQSKSGCKHCGEWEYHIDTKAKRKSWPVHGRKNILIAKGTWQSHAKD